MKKDKKGFFSEFKEFIMRGNVLDMAVGVIIASAFGKITTSLVNDVIMPAVGSLLGKVDLSELNIVLREAVMDGETVVTPAVQIGIGTFLVTIIDFLIIAFVVFLIVKCFSKAKEIADAKLSKTKEEEVEVIEEKAPTTEELLTQILAEIKKD